MQDDLNITGVEKVVFGVEDIEECRRFLTHYGLAEIKREETLSIWEALDGSSIELRLSGDVSLPPAQIEGPTGRLYVWGVKDKGSLDRIAAELSRDRDVYYDGDGYLNAQDDDGNRLAFRVTERRPYDAAAALINVAGRDPVRPVNQRADFRTQGLARSMGHVVFWSQDPTRSMAFYRDRLNFRITDEVKGNAGIFARAKDHRDHHSIFFLAIGHAPFKPSLQHIEFQFADMQEVMVNGDGLSRAGFRTAFGPGRHELGSNWYWYILSPMGAAFELAADMDHADDNWQPGLWESMDSVKGWSMSYGALGPSANMEAQRKAS